MEKRMYSLPKLPYDYKALEPAISEAQLTIHHQKHHQAYVNGANADLEKMDKAHGGGTDLDMKSLAKDLSWNIGGHIMHSLFWENMAPAGKGGGGAPKGPFADAIAAEFGSFERFRKEFAQTASSVEGSGWAALTFCKKTRRPIIMQVEKHNTNVYPSYRILMVLDVFEHAYYIDYRNDRAKFIENFWTIVNWEKVGERFTKVAAEGE